MSGEARELCGAKKNPGRPAVETHSKRCWGEVGGKNSWLCKGLAHLSITQLTSALSRYDDIPHADGLKKTQGGGESTQKQ